MLPADSPFTSLPALGPHPAAAELRAYAEGTLAPAEQHIIEAHALDCERCTEVVEGFAMTEAAATDEALATLRTRLQARLSEAEPAPVAAPWAWPRVAAAAAVLALVAGGLWSREHYQTPPPPAIARLETMSSAAPDAAPMAGPAASPRQPTEAEAAASAPVVPAPDYAVVLPGRGRAGAAQRMVLPPRPQATPPFPQSVVVADVEVAPADQKQASGTADQPVADEEMVASAPAAKMDAVSFPATKKMADSSASSTVAAGLGDSRKAKVASAPAVASAPTGRGLPTRMPAAPSIRPAPVVGFPALRDYVRRQVLAFDPLLKEPPRNGTVRVRFIVGADGKLNDLKVVHSLGAPYDNEALRIVCEGPAWQAGIAGGRLAPLPAEVEVFF